MLVTGAAVAWLYGGRPLYGTLLRAWEHGCPWSVDLADGALDCCLLAAAGGHPEVLRWLHAGGMSGRAQPPLGGGHLGVDVGTGARLPLECGPRRRRPGLLPTRRCRRVWTLLRLGPGPGTYFLPPLRSSTF